jgi:hypothetical protein
MGCILHILSLLRLPLRLLAWCFAAICSVCCCIRLILWKRRKKRWECHQCPAAAAQLQDVLTCRTVCGELCAARDGSVVCDGVWSEGQQRLDSVTGSLAPADYGLFAVDRRSPPASSATLSALPATAAACCFVVTVCLWTGYAVSCVRIVICGSNQL